MFNSQKSTCFLYAPGFDDGVDFGLMMMVVVTSV